jgi:mRNA-degrading endonuclease RelE of RelBE toxin-antitoxin system
MTRWRLVVAASAERGLNRLPPKVASAVVEFMVGPLVDDPQRVGKPLLRELSGYLTARRGVYRIIYRVNEERRTVEVVRIDHRSRVYRSR